MLLALCNVSVIRLENSYDILRKIKYLSGIAVPLLGKLNASYSVNLITAGISLTSAHEQE